MYKVVIVTALILFAGCAVNSGVVDLGNNAYMVSRQAPTGFHGMGNLRADALKEAKAQCDKEAKDLIVHKTVDAEPPYILGNFPKTEVYFECRKKDDKAKYL